MSWRYMTTFTESRYEEVDGHWTIREWYDATDSHGSGFTSNDVEPYGNSREELIAGLEQMLEAARSEEYLELKETDEDYWKVHNENR